ncbi:hypothetical protein PIB30_008301 [Stylosanthes scabra]|uniref:Uncharacterized protein n=1 Tax=Stylosanthes scabra TaxID=79078 RepID=A0ABU6S4B6_9FABA|nr:hypothetical protein [Stylosanthes scabra]
MICGEKPNSIRKLRIRKAIGSNWIRSIQKQLHIQSLAFTTLLTFGDVVAVLCLHPSFTRRPASIFQSSSCPDAVSSVAATPPPVARLSVEFFKSSSPSSPKSLPCHNLRRWLSSWCRRLQPLLAAISPPPVAI